MTTGSGIHPVAFTAEVMRLTQFAPEPVIDAWHRLHTGDETAVADLTEATAAWQRAAR